METNYWEDAYAYGMKVWNEMKEKYPVEKKDEDELSELIYDYKRRLETITLEINKNLRLYKSETESISYIRLKTKASCYRTFISELEKNQTT